MKHSNSFYYDLDFGERAEDYLNQIFSDGKKIEVKYDRMAHITGNIYVEFESRGKPSGIATSKANYWIFVIDKKDYAIIVNIKKLKEICRIAYQLGHIIYGGDNNTSKGILVPITQINEYTTTS